MTEAATPSRLPITPPSGHPLNRFKRGLDILLASATVLFAVAMLVVVTIQVYGRFALTKAPSWTEEASRYLFIYMVSCAAALGIQTQAYIGFDALIHLLPKRAQIIMHFVIHLVIAALMGVILWYAIRLIGNRHNVVTTALGIRESYVLASMGILFGSTLMYALIESGQRWNDFKRTRTNA